MHIVAFEDCVSEDPEVIDTGDEVDDAERLVLSLADVSEEISSPNLDPMVLEHEPDVIKLVTALRVEDAVLFIGASPPEQLLEEVRRDRAWDHAQADTRREHSLHLA